MTDPNQVEAPPIVITSDDIQIANQLSLHCPICAGAVEKEVGHAALQPVVCKKCETLYHQACWQQNKNSCAVLGCGCQEHYVYGSLGSPILVITAKDVAAVPSNYGSQTKALKEQARREARQAAAQQGNIPKESFLARLFKALFKALRDSQ